MDKLIILGVISLLVIVGTLIIQNDSSEEVVIDMEEVYQGPVPQGYDVEHFRETGETVLEGDIINNG